MRSHWLPVLAGGLLLGLAWAQAPTIEPDGTVVLFDFEQPEELALWHQRDLTGLALTTEWAAHGQSAAAITYHQWSAGKEEWPAITISAKALGQGAVDISGFDEVRFEAYNPGQAPAEVKLFLADQGGRRFSRIFVVPPRRPLSAAVAVTDLRASLDTRRVAELHFFVTRPANTYTVCVDYVRLGYALTDRAERLATEARALEAELAAQGGPLPADVADSVDMARRTRASCELALRRARGPLDQPGAASALRRRLERLEVDLAALRGVLPRVHGLAYARQTGADDFVLAVESPMRKVFLDTASLQSPFAASYSLQAARNEHESFQVVALPLTRNLARVTWEATPLRHATGATVPVSVRLVGYVDCRQPSYPVSRTGWWPDPLLDFQTSVERVPLGEVLPLWVTADVPPDAPAGWYAGTVTVSAEGSRTQSVAVRLEVWPFSLPEHTHLRTALSFRDTVAKLYPDRDPVEVTQQYEDWMLGEYYLNPGSIYSGPPSWDAERLRELRGMGLNAMNLCYVYGPPGDEFDPDAFWREFEQQMVEVGEYLKVVDAAGVRDLCYIYCFDERPSNQLDVVFEAAAKIKERFPDIEVMTTALDDQFGLNRDNGQAMDIWVPLTPKFDANAARIVEARAAGRDIWWYICIGPQHPYANWFIEYPAIEARLIMGAMTAKYRPGGFLYYAVNRWPVNDRVITSGPRTDWNPASFLNNNGDGSVMCAGPKGPLATVRLENIRDGIEDYEYYHMLRGLLEARGLPVEPGAVSAAVVQNLTTFTGEPAVLLAERQRVAREIVRLVGGR